MGDGRFSDTSARNHFPPDVHQTIQKGACCYDDTFGIDLSAPYGAYADSGNTWVIGLTRHASWARLYQ